MFKNIRIVSFTDEQLASYSRKVESDPKLFLDDEHVEYPPELMEWLKKSVYYSESVLVATPSSLSTSSKL
jgi:hypothetical protein